MNLKVWTTIGVSACLGLGACENNDGTGSASDSASDSNTAGSTAAQTTTQGTSPVTNGTTAEVGSDSQDADSTPTTTPTTTNPDTTGTSTLTTGPDSDGTAVSASDGTSTDPMTGTGGTTIAGTTTVGDEPCVASGDCAEGEVCAAKVCVPFDGNCVSNADCHGDTFCCAKNCLPQGEAPGACIDFGLEPEGDAHEDCEGPVPVGLFQADLQCEWLAPPVNDPFPNHKNVLTSPLAAPLPHLGASSTEIVIVSYNFSDGGAESGYGSNPLYYGVIRILDTRNCDQLETIHDPDNKMIGATPPAIGDLDGDGVPEIVTHRAGTGVIAFKWDDGLQKYKTWWVALNTGVVNTIRWDGPSIHDLDNDGFPEVISASAVFDGATGDRLNAGQLIPGAGAGVIPVLGDLDNDGNIELIAGAVWRWNIGMDKWEMAYPGAPANRHYGFADFGTPGALPADFDPTKLDGKAEIVTVGGNLVRLHTLSGQLLLQGAIGSGGPPTIGDFDKDGFPEIAAAGGTSYVVYDLECKNAGPGCIGNYVRWSRPSQDASSATTGSSIFDFEFDGQAEAVYGDECFTRVYEGKTGEVLYSSYRTSCTWYENPIVADVDNDQNTEIVIGSNANCNVACPTIDPIHRGVRCLADADCGGGTCNAGYCRCADIKQCTAGHVCAAPPAGTPGAGNTCRAEHPLGAKKTGVRVLRDTLDRWSSSRAIWNQHAYNITNVADDATIPQTAKWNQNFLDPKLNNFRQNEQGDIPPTALADITSDQVGCMLMGNVSVLSAEVCNRGTKTVGAGLKTAFYQGDPKDGVVLCVAQTVDALDVEKCVTVSCEANGAVMGDVQVNGNDDGMGGKNALECIYTNNDAKATPIECK
ncbi:MAG: VCBS repeat-containing protein [Nannocystis sp.]|nr:VCBS repeat-containing protein [Nannocystis sp.]MBA3547417.1 VCBS repeat-containing protein [Nannocystis sp.]